MIKPFPFLLVAIATTAGSFFLSLAVPSAHAQSSEDAKIEARVGAWGRNCKNAIAAKYPKYSMSDISVELGATLKQSIDSGETTLKDINSTGLSFNWTAKGKNGYCNTDGKGNVEELKKF